MHLYTDAQKGLSLCEQNYENAELINKKALNAVHNLYYSTEPYRRKVVSGKLITAQSTLQQLLNNYLNEFKNICNANLEKNGYDIDRRKIISKVPHAKNFYEKTELYTEFY